MTLYSNMQICGDACVTVQRRDGTVWVTIMDGNQSITMEAKHVLALDQALSRFVNDEWAADHPEAAAVSGVFTAVDAAERVTA